MVYPRVLFVAHGKKHNFYHYGYKPLQENMELFIQNGMTIDQNHECDPCVVMDVTKYDIDINPHFKRTFDYIFVMAAPTYVLKSKRFWRTIVSWLAPRGVVMSMLPEYALALTDNDPKKFANMVKSWVPNIRIKNPLYYTTDRTIQYIVATEKQASYRSCLI